MEVHRRKGLRLGFLEIDLEAPPQLALDRIDAEWDAALERLKAFVEKD
jgi:hypothetical protein